jgi:hypothetical protein
LRNFFSIGFPPSLQVLELDSWLDHSVEPYYWASSFLEQVKSLLEDLPSISKAHPDLTCIRLLSVHDNPPNTWTRLYVMHIDVTTANVVFVPVTERERWRPFCQSCEHLDEELRFDPPGDS